METQTLLFLIVGYVVGLLIFYIVIKAAVKDGTERMYKVLRNIANLKIDELKKEGFTDEALKASLGRKEGLSPLQRLQQQLEKGEIDQKQFDYYKTRLYEVPEKD